MNDEQYTKNRRKRPKRKRISLIGNTINKIFEILIYNLSALLILVHRKMGLK